MDIFKIALPERRETFSLPLLLLPNNKRATEFFSFSLSASSSILLQPPTHSLPTMSCPNPHAYHISRHWPLCAVFVEQNCRLNEGIEEVGGIRCRVHFIVLGVCRLLLYESFRVGKSIFLPSFPNFLFYTHHKTLAARVCFARKKR